MVSSNHTLPVPLVHKGLLKEPSLRKAADQPVHQVSQVVAKPGKWWSHLLLQARRPVGQVLVVRPLLQLLDASSELAPPYRVNKNNN